MFPFELLYGYDLTFLLWYTAVGAKHFFKATLKKTKDRSSRRWVRKLSSDVCKAEVAASPPRLRLRMSIKSVVWRTERGDKWQYKSHIMSLSLAWKMLTYATAVVVRVPTPSLLWSSWGRKSWSFAFYGVRAGVSDGKHQELKHARTYEHSHQRVHAIHGMCRAWSLKISFVHVDLAKFCLNSWLASWDSISRSSMHISQRWFFEGSRKCGLRVKFLTTIDQRP